LLLFKINDTSDLATSIRSVSFFWASSDYTVTVWPGSVTVTEVSDFSRCKIAKIQTSVECLNTHCAGTIQTSVGFWHLSDMTIAVDISPQAGEKDDNDRS